MAAKAMEISIDPRALRLAISSNKNSYSYRISFTSNNLQNQYCKILLCTSKRSRVGGSGDYSDINGDEYQSSSENAIELQKSIEEYPYQLNSKDSCISPPRALTSASLSNLASERPRTRVAYQAVERWIVDRGVLPIENSLGGSIHRNYDLLLRHRLHIVGEVKIAVRHCLMANSGVKLENLTRVMSLPQALAQCENTLTRLGLVKEAVDDTAGAAKYIASHKIKDVGAVASKTAASIYGLDILAEDIQVRSVETYIYNEGEAAGYLINSWITSLVS